MLITRLTSWFLSVNVCKEMVLITNVKSVQTAETCILPQLLLLKERKEMATVSLTLETCLHLYGKKER